MSFLGFWWVGFAGFKKPLKTSFINECGDTLSEIEVEVENVVASATIENDLDLNRIAELFDNIEYNPEQFPGLIYRLQDPKTATLVFSSGKMVCTGSLSPSEAKKAINKIVEDFREQNIEITGEPKIEIQNVVASSDLGSKLNLDAIAMALPQCEYEPEQFPGLVYRVKEPRVVILLFTSGKIVCTGAKSEKDIHRGIEKIIEKLDKYDLLGV